MVEQRIELEGWMLAVDVAATRAAYAALAGGAADGCGCAPCRNYAAQRAGALPEPWRDAVARAGVDPTKEVEVCRLARTAPGRHVYALSFPVVGRRVGVADGAQPGDGPAGGERLLVHETSRHVPDAFVGAAGAEVELRFELGWVLDEDEVP